MNALQYMAAGIAMNLLAATANGQHAVTITITGLPAAPLTEALYITGSFNGWNPKDEKYRLLKDTQGVFIIDIKDLAAGTHEFKFTRGSWDKVETDKEGADLNNRIMAVRSDTSFDFSVAGWKDEFKQKPKLSTASAQVIIADTAFAMPQLGSSRRIWVYLPKDYEQSPRKRYPVLYMHDGQNLFDDATAFAGEWGVDETMDSMAHPCIVVGIDNGGVKRMNEYNPNNNKQFGRGEGKLYLSFIVHNLKPYIDKKYRTLHDAKHTYMAGSSMGGLISFYAGLYYPEIFGVLGIFSPSFWIAPQLKTQVKQLASQRSHGRQRYYFYAGGLEEMNMEKNMQGVAETLQKAAILKTNIVTDPQGRHQEAAWARIFPAFYSWITTHK